MKDQQMKPIIVIPPETMSAEDIQQLRDNGLCVVVAKDPSAVKFLDSIPAAIGRGAVEEAAIALSRKLLTVPADKYLQRAEITSWFTELLIRGTPLDPVHITYQQRFDQAKAEEFERIAREEARAERAAKKAAKLATAPKPTPKL